MEESFQHLGEKQSKNEKYSYENIKYSFSLCSASFEQAWEHFSFLKLLNMKLTELKNRGSVKTGWNDDGKDI